MRVLGGRYQLLEEIGAGGMARVWRAHDEVLDRTVAVKLLTAEHTSDPVELTRARNEARCAARLAHPNVAAVYDFGTSLRGERGAAYVVMELVEGPLLSEYLKSGPLNWRFAVRVVAEVSAGLAAAHSQGIVHRDIKPSNVVLSQSGAKILDFGIAASVGVADVQPDGTVRGTSAYMAPERLTRQPVAPPLDMYALGVLLYRNLTARLPWSATTDIEMLEAHRSQPPAPLPPINGLVPEATQICASCLDKDPTKRPTAVAAALILAASVNAQIYLPTLLKPPPRSRTGALDDQGLDNDSLDAVTVSRKHTVWTQ
jgi:serine/threonine-protein kinase